MGIESGRINSVGRTDDGDVKAKITVTKKEGILNPKLITETINVTMTEERYLEEVEHVNQGNLFYLDRLENGEHYE